MPLCDQDTPVDMPLPYVGRASRRRPSYRLGSMHTCEENTISTSKDQSLVTCCKHIMPRGRNTQPYTAKASSTECGNMSDTHSQTLGEPLRKRARYADDRPVKDSGIATPASSFTDQSAGSVDSDQGYSDQPPEHPASSGPSVTFPDIPAFAVSEAFIPRVGTDSHHRSPCRESYPSKSSI